MVDQAALMVQVEEDLEALVAPDLFVPEEYTFKNKKTIFIIDYGNFNISIKHINRKCK
jgi:hypothetical protein